MNSNRERPFSQQTAHYTVLEWKMIAKSYNTKCKKKNTLAAIEYKSLYL